MSRVRAALLAAPALVLGAYGGALAAQDPGAIVFDSELPRVLVFVAEEGEGGVATRDLNAFLREAGFPLVDPALAHTAGERELVRAALAGDEGAAVQLGRDFGAHVLIIGRADWGAAPSPADPSLVTATSEIEVRALRLDEGKVVATARADAREIDATAQAARTKALRAATESILQAPFMGRIMNDWSAEPWREASYWRPDVGGVETQLSETRASADAPGVAILVTDVRPAPEESGTRGLGVVKKGDRSSSLFNPVRLEGIVVGARSVTVEGQPARLEPLDAGQAARLGLVGVEAMRFSAETTLPMSQDTVRVLAAGPGGSTTEAVAAPRVNRRWAVVVGVGDYRSSDIPNLRYARADAKAVHDFLLSPEAGPFEPENVLFLADEQATGANLREALFVFLQQARWDDLVFIYFAGHGAPDPNRPDNLYLLPHDAELDALAATGFPMWDVKTALRRQIAAERVIVIADACHSAGTADRGELGSGDNPIAGSFAQLFTPSRRLMMTAADVHEFSLEDARWGGHGVFTYFLLEGLRGEGDADGDGIVTFTEAFDFVSRRVAAETGGRQNPQRSGLGDVPLAVVGEPARATGAGSDGG